MKAVVYTEYGSPDVLHLKDVPKPVPGDGEVLIRIHAVSLNRSDWEGLTGMPAWVRSGGLVKPRRQILGSDIAGRVESVGPGTPLFQPGDEVYGDILGSLGGFAEYVCVRGRNLLPKPAWMTFEQAAAIPQAGVIALKGIVTKGRVRPGDRVLVNGAGGGGGTFSIQLAKLHGADVTAVDHGEKHEFLRSLGADHVVDYTREDFTRVGSQYDLIVDLIAERSARDYARALRPGGRYYAVGGALATFLQIALLGPWIRACTGKRVGMLVAMPNRADIATVAALCETGAIRIVIDRVCPLSELPDALRALGAGRTNGKVIITVA